MHKQIDKFGSKAGTFCTAIGLLSYVMGVDAVILFGEPTPLEVIRELQPDVLVKGAGYAEDQIVGADIVRARGGRIVRVTLVDGQSTTKVIEKSRRK